MQTVRINLAFTFINTGVSINIDQTEVTSEIPVSVRNSIMIIIIITYPYSSDKKKLSLNLMLPSTKNVIIQIKKQTMTTSKNSCKASMFT